MHFLSFKPDAQKQAKKFAASFLAFTMLVMPAYGAVIGGANVETSGNTTTINGGYVNGNNTFNQFTEFGVDAGHTVNQHFTTGNAVNMVNSQININGIYNSFMNGGGAGTGNVVFISPLGMIVGAGAQMNVGSLHTIIPTQATYDSMTANFNNLIGGKTAPTMSSSTDISSVDPLWSAFDTDYTKIMSGTDIGTNGVNIQGNITASGLVRFEADAINFTNTGLITTSNMGGVELIANTGGIQGSDNLNIDAAGNVVLSSKNGNIGSTNAVKYKTDGTLTANAANGSISVISNGKQAKLSDISAKNGISIVSDSGISQSDSTAVVNSTSGNVSLVNSSTDSFNLKNISNASGDILIESNGTITLASGAQISAGNNLIITAADGLILAGTLGGTNVALDGSNISGTAVINATKLAMTAGTGNIGSSSAALSLSGSIDEVNVNSNGIVNLTKSGNLNIKTVQSNGEVKLSTTNSGNISISDTINAGSNKVTLNSAGNITTNSTNALTASNAEVSAVGNVGSEGAKFNLTAQNVKVQSTSGNVYVSGNTAVTFNNSTAAGVLDLSTKAGDLTTSGSLSGNTVNIASASNAIIGGTVNSTGTLAITAADTLTINTTNGAASLTSGSTTALTGQNILQSGQGTAVSSGGKLTLNAASGNIKNSDDSSFVVNSPDMDITAQSIKLDSLAQNSVISSITASNANITAKNLTINSSAMDTAVMNVEKLTLGGNLTTQNGLTVNAANIDAGSYNIANAVSNEINITTSNSAVLNNVTNTGRNISLKGDGSYLLNGTVSGSTVAIEGSSINSGASGLIDAANVSLNSKNAIGTDSNALKLTNSSGDVNVTSATAQNGGLNLTSNKQTTFNNIESTGKTKITTTSTANLKTSGKLNGTEISLTSAGSIDAQNTSVSGNLYADAISVVSINVAQGNLNVKDIVSGANVAITSVGNLILDGEIAANAVTLTGANIDGTLIGGNLDSLTLNAGTGSIGSASALALSGTIAEINADAQNGINITKSGDFNLNNVTSDSNISLTSTASGNVNITGTVSSSSADVSISSAGNITQTGSSRAVNANGNINLVSAGAVSNADSPKSFYVNSASGKINITSDGDVNIGTLAGDSIKLGNIALSSSDFSYSGGDLVIDGNITAENINFTNIDSFTQNTNTTVTASIGNILVETSGDALLNGLLQASSGNVKVSASNINSSSSNAITASTIELIAQNKIGSDSSALNFTSTGEVKAQSGTGMNLNSKSASTTFGPLNNTTSGDILVTTAGNTTFDTVTNTNGNISLGKSGAAGNYTLNGLVSGKDINIDTSGSVVSSLAKAISGENITIAAGSIGNADALNISASANVDLSGTNGININSVDNDLNITNAVSSNGDVKISASGTDSDITIDGISAKNNINIDNTTNGLITLNGDMTVNSGKTATITTAMGANSGVVIASGKTVTNNGTLNVTNNGDMGVNFAGILNNSGTASIISSSGVILSGAITNAVNSNISVANNGGNLDVSSSLINNSGKITLNNSGNGALNLTGNVENQKNASFDVINNGAGGLNFDGSATIENFGVLHLANNAGTFNMNGTVNMAQGSTNIFEDGTANDFSISTDLTNDGAVVSFLQTGTGNLVVKQGTNITNNNSGTINLTNSNGGSFTLENNAVITNNSNSTVNINNTSTAGNVNIDGQITAVSGSTNNKVNISNSGVDIIVNSNTNILNISDLRITNTTASTGSLNINGAITNNHNVTLENLNNGASTGINIGSQPLSTTGLLTMTNYGQTGLVINGNQISSTGGIHLTSNNSITINGTLTNKETTTHNGLQITNIADNGTVNNSGISINGNVITSSKYVTDVNGNIVNVNKIVNENTEASSVINIANGAQIVSNGGIDIISDGGQGVLLDGTVINKVVDGMNYGGNINVAANNASIALKHYDFDNLNADYANTPVRVKNEQGDISIKAKNITNSTGKVGVSLIATGDIKLTATDGSVGVMDNVINNSKNDGFVGIDDTISVNVLAGGKTSANASDSVNVRGHKMVNYLTTKNMEYGSVSAGNTAFLPAAEGYIKADSVSATNAYIYSGHSKADGGFIEIGKVNAVNDSGFFSLEADGDVTVKSSQSNKPVNFDFVISKSGKVDLALNGNSQINTITAPESVKISSTGDLLHIKSLGKFVDDSGNVISRGNGIIPSSLDLKVTGTESGAKNSTLSIDNAYVKDSVTMRADNIYAQESIDMLTGKTNGHGFHSANENKELVKFDIQGVNTPQYDKFSPIIDFGNPNYHPDPSDASVRDLKLTIGDVENPDALFGAQFDKVYSEYAHINATGKVNTSTNVPVAAEFNFDNITVNQKGRLQNNKYTIDVNNVDKLYDYSADATLYTKLTGSFRTYMGENVTIDTTAPIIVYNPHRIFNIPQTENSFQRLTNKSNRIEEETTLYRFRDGRKNTRTAKDRKDIRWSITDNEHQVLGSSTTESGAVITDILDISKGGMLVATNNPLKKGELLNVNFMYKGIPFDVQGEVVRVEDNNKAGVKFVDMDRFTSNIILYMAMMTENL